jgi:hypothetical protein
LGTAKRVARAAKAAAVMQKAREARAAKKRAKKAADRAERAQPDWAAAPPQATGQPSGGDALVAVRDERRTRLIRLLALDVPQEPMAAAELLRLLERRGSVAGVLAEAMD